MSSNVPMLKFKGNKSFSPFANISEGEALRQTWKIITKISAHLEYGERLENISWRLWKMHDQYSIDSTAKSKKYFRKFSKNLAENFDREKNMSIADLPIPDLDDIGSRDAAMRRELKKLEEEKERRERGMGKMMGVFAVEAAPPPGSAPLSRKNSASSTHEIQQGATGVQRKKSGTKRTPNGQPKSRQGSSSLLAPMEALSQPPQLTQGPNQFGNPPRRVNSIGRNHSNSSAAAAASSPLDGTNLNMSSPQQFIGQHISPVAFPQQQNQLSSAMDVDSNAMNFSNSGVPNQQMQYNRSAPQQSSYRDFISGSSTFNEPGDQMNSTFKNTNSFTSNQQSLQPQHTSNSGLNDWGLAAIDFSSVLGGMDDDSGSGHITPAPIPFMSGIPANNQTLAQLQLQQQLQQQLNSHQQQQMQQQQAQLNYNSNNSNSITTTTNYGFNPSLSSHDLTGIQTTSPPESDSSASPPAPISNNNNNIDMTRKLSGDSIGGTKIAQCSNCEAVHTPVWRHGSAGELLCNACSMFEKMHPGQKRPKSRRSSSNSSGRFATPGGLAMTPNTEDGQMANEETAVCPNCGTGATPMWRKTDDGRVLCNACGLYLKLHHSDRPPSMKNDFVQRRKPRTYSSSSNISTSAKNNNASITSQSNQSFDLHNANQSDSSSVIHTPTDGLTSLAGDLGFSNLQQFSTLGLSDPPLLGANHQQQSSQILPQHQQSYGFNQQANLNSFVPSLNQQPLNDTALAAQLNNAFQAGAASVMMNGMSSTSSSPGPGAPGSFGVEHQMKKRRFSENEGQFLGGGSFSQRNSGLSGSNSNPGSRRGSFNSSIRNGLMMTLSQPGSPNTVNSSLPPTFGNSQYQQQMQQQQQHQLQQHVLPPPPPGETQYTSQISQQGNGATNMFQQQPSQLKQEAPSPGEGAPIYSDTFHQQQPSQLRQTHHPQPFVQSQQQQQQQQQQQLQQQPVGGSQGQTNLFDTYFNLNGPNEQLDQTAQQNFQSQNGAGATLSTNNNKNNANAGPMMTGGLQWQPVWDE